MRVRLILAVEGRRDKSTHALHYTTPHDTCYSIEGEEQKDNKSDAAVIIIEAVYIGVIVHMGVFPLSTPLSLSSPSPIS